MEKLIWNNMTAVLISTDYGPGWTSSFYDKELAKKAIFDPEIAQRVLDKPQNASQAELNSWLASIKELIKYKYPDEYTSGVEDLKVEWIPIGTRFRIKEYDGYESVEKYDPDSYMTA